MRTIRRTAAFKRDYRREKKGRFGRILDVGLLEAVTELAPTGRWPRATGTTPWPVRGRTTGIATSAPTWC